MSDRLFWATFLAWGAVGFLTAHVLARRWQQVHWRWLAAVSEREAGRGLQEPGSVIRTYLELVASVRRGYGGRFLQSDPDPDIERLRLASLTEWRRFRPRFIVFMVCWLGGLLLLSVI